MKSLNKHNFLLIAQPVQKSTTLTYHSQFYTESWKQEDLTQTK